MKIRVSALANIILATVLLTSIFFMTTTSSSSSSGYDPWIDTDDDGDIDFDDIVAMAMIYGTSGTPVNKTALLLDLQDRVDALEERVEALEKRTGLPPPDYDSGWVSIDVPGTEFVHNLGTTEVLVYIIGRHPIAGIHQLSYGGDYSADYGSIGLSWAYLTPTTIAIFRSSDDNFWGEVRVMMWKIQQPPT